MNIFNFSYGWAIALVFFLNPFSLGAMEVGIWSNEDSTTDIGDISLSDTVPFITLNSLNDNPLAQGFFGKIENHLQSIIIHSTISFFSNWYNGTPCSKAAVQNALVEGVAKEVGKTLPFIGPFINLTVVSRMHQDPQLVRRKALKKAIGNSVTVLTKEVPYYFHPRIVQLHGTIPDTARPVFSLFTEISSTSFAKLFTHLWYKKPIKSFDMVHKTCKKKTMKLLRNSGSFKQLVIVYTLALMNGEIKPLLKIMQEDSLAPHLSKTTIQQLIKSIKQLPTTTIIAPRYLTGG